MSARTVQDIFNADVARALAEAKRREVAAVRDQERIVAEARMVGVPWSVIGTALGTSRQAAQMRFGRTDADG
jgi:hypothetical protein